MRTSSLLGDRDVALVPGCNKADLGVCELAELLVVPTGKLLGFMLIVGPSLTTEPKPVERLAAVALLPPPAALPALPEAPCPLRESISAKTTKKQVGVFKIQMKY